MPRSAVSTLALDSGADIPALSAKARTVRKSDVVTPQEGVDRVRTCVRPGRERGEQLPGPRWTLEAGTWKKTGTLADDKEARDGEKERLVEQEQLVGDYNDEEYERWLKSEEWSKEETDKLVELCKTFGMRFPVVWDRWKLAAKENGWSSCRSIEELKERFFHVQRMIAEKRVQAVDMSDATVDAQIQSQKDGQDSAASKNPFLSFSYDKQVDVHAKAELEKFMGRSEEDLVSAAFLALKARDLELEINQLCEIERSKVEVFELLNTLAIISNSSVPHNYRSLEIAPSPKRSSYSSPVKRANNNRDSTKRPEPRKTREDLYGADYETLSSLLTGIPVDMHRSSSFSKIRTDTVYLRSAQPAALVNDSHRHMKAIDLRLDAEGIKGSTIYDDFFTVAQCRRNMKIPSVAVCFAFDLLRRDISLLQTLLKYVTKREEDAASTAHTSKKHKRNSSASSLEFAEPTGSTKKQKTR